MSSLLSEQEAFFKKYFPENSTSINFELLPDYVSKLLQDFLMPLIPDTPVIALIQMINVKFSQIVSHYRCSFTITSNGIPKLINYYGLTFMDSGMGKDKPLMFLEDYITNSYQEHFQHESSSWFKLKTDEVISESETLKSKAAKDKYLEANLPRTLNIEMSDATAEGFAKVRATFQEAGFGGTFVKIDEFGDYITSDNNTRQEFLSALKTAYDGNLGLKEIKTEKTTSVTKNIPSNAIFYTSKAGLFTGKNNDKLMRFLNRGMARRCFVCCPDDSDLTGYHTYKNSEYNTMDEIFVEKDLEINAIENSKQFSEIVSKILNNTYNDAVYALNDNAYIAYKYYVKLCKGRAQKFKKEFESGLISELLGRHWKMLKLAGIIAVVSHPELKEITAKDILYAVYQTELFGLHFQRFYGANDETDDHKLFKFFLKNRNNWVSKSEIRCEKFVNENYFKHWFSENLQLVMERAEAENLTIIEKKFTRNTIKYKMIENTIEGSMTDIDKLQLSISDHVAYNYIPIKIRFSNIHTILKSKYQYSPSIFTDNHRKLENYLGGNNMIVLDFDDGKTTVEMAKKRFEPYVNIISTTKSHKKQKDTKPACDRFRVVLPVMTSIVITYKEFQTLMDCITKHFGSDNQAKDASRAFAGFENAEYYYNFEGKLFDWTLFYTNDNGGNQTRASVQAEYSRLSRAKYNKYEYTDNNKSLKKWLGSSKMLEVMEVGRIKAGENRNAELFRIYKWLIDDSEITTSEAQGELIRINNSGMFEPLPHSELELLMYYAS